MAFELQESGFRLRDVLKIVYLPEAIYHYHRQRFNVEDPDLEWKMLIQSLFEKHKGRYEYSRIHLELRAQGHMINHKKVQRLMSELNLTCVKFIRKSRYRSYKGTVGTIAKNRLNRMFKTSFALQKIVTDFKEFKCIGEEKLYLSPMIDLYNDEITGSDRMSISKRPTFMGLLTQEMYYGETIVSYEELKQRIERYIYYYNHKRIKQKLAGMSPVHYRKPASQSAA